MATTTESATVHLESAKATDPPENGTPSSGSEFAGAIKYRTEFVNFTSGQVVASEDKKDENLTSGEPPVMEYVELRITQEAAVSSGMTSESTTKKEYHEYSRGHSYITILSPAVCEALRCVVDYYPSVNLSGNTIKVSEPFEIFVFFEQELTEYRNRLADAASGEELENCANRYAYKHIGVVQEFVRNRIQKDVDAERERHSRGYATFDMLWLLYRPGSDVYYDLWDVGEHEPYVVRNVSYSLVNGSTNQYEITYWNIDGTKDWVGPCETSATVQRFAGEKEIVSLNSYPCEYLSFSKDVEDGDAEKIREHFTNRGKKWYKLRNGKKCYAFDGFTISFPRRKYTGLTMVDPIAYAWWLRSSGDSSGDNPRVTLEETAAHPSAPFEICSCSRCEELIYRHAVKPKFAGYSRVNALTVKELTEHQYFLCDCLVESFVFKMRSWQHLHVSGFEETSFDKSLFERLVLKESTKDTIKDLTEMYIRDNTRLSLVDENPYNKVTTVHKKTQNAQENKIWSPDFIQGKGDGLIILLHGRPGVGKTYTAECIAEFTERPLLPLTCSDIGVEPEQIESSMMKWFKLAEGWGAIVLIDEADIYMEERQPQDLTRNHLVAGFLRALEYFKGILFLTTNRVGTFDEAFISRIHVPIYYPEFQPEDRIRIWDSFFEKLEEDREATMRIMQSTKDYTQSQDVLALKWNGREIRNAFQVAVALADAQNNKDKQGRVLIKPDHIKAAVQMSREFKDYLVHVHKTDMGKKAALMGNRFDAYGQSNKPARG
ncbi:hypothetical protein FQN54_003880 [Arachnomyces sp. PD_36]|nr:hypothetical protein FQN54_003880 [Arachnomyces sp. PD_36]